MKSFWRVRLEDILQTACCSQGSGQTTRAPIVVSNQPGRHALAVHQKSGGPDSEILDLAGQYCMTA